MSTTMSLKEARKLLGKEISEKMSDEELERTLLLLEDIARDALKTAVKIQANSFTE